MALTEARRGLVAVGLGALVGAVMGAWTGGAAAGVATYFCWHAYWLYSLVAWLHAGCPRYADEWPAPWADFKAAIESGRERERAREAPALDFGRFEDAAQALPSGVVILRADGRIVWLNPLGVEHLGLRFPDDLGRPVLNFVRNPAFADYYAGGRFESPFEMPSPVTDGRFLELRVVPYGDGLRLLETRDVTPVRQLEQTRRDFVANVSHELRTPLTVVVGYVETLLSEPVLPQGWRRPLEQTAEQAERMRSIVEDLLRLARLENDPDGAPRVAVDVPALLRSALEDARAIDENRHTFELDVGDGPVLLGERDELMSAVSNLVTNAVRYTPAGGTVSLRWRRLPAGAELDVVDTGVGIGRRHIPRLTERFYRVDKARSRAVGGTGLGLAIVKHVLLRHDAILDVDSTPGQGSRFTCRFPASRVPRESASAAAVPADAALGTRRG